jgi:hypothetical protein
MDCYVNCSSDSASVITVNINYCDDEWKSSPVVYVNGSEYEDKVYCGG